jgi:hypothetical protein
MLYKSFCTNPCRGLVARFDEKTYGQMNCHDTPYIINPIRKNTALGPG